MENDTKSVSKRLQSLDALRGFDMFWIMGGETIFIGLAAITGWPVFKWWAEQLEHVKWHGFHFYDMIFPLFLFIAGISFPFSLAKRIAGGETKNKIYRHVIYRGVILVLLGILYNNGIRFDLGDLRYGSVLGRIGLAWMFAALVFMNTKLNWRIVWFSIILLGYWILLALVPAPDGNGTDVFSREGNFASYIDRILMPGKLYLGNHDPEGILSTIPAISTALMGMFTGEFLQSKLFSNNLVKKAGIIAAAGLIFILTGKIWDSAFPINKNLWTSSFVCFAGGLSLLLFALFFLIIDVWNFRKWSFFFVVIGMNPITIYLANRIINFRNAARFFFGGFTEILPETWTQLINGISVTAVGWLFLYILYKKKIFLKV
ncbi:MAG: acyltransferase family protein [Bacteroidales bacterium]